MNNSNIRRLSAQRPPVLWSNISEKNDLNHLIEKIIESGHQFINEFHGTQKATSQKISQCLIINMTGATDRYTRVKQLVDRLGIHGVYRLNAFIPTQSCYLDELKQRSPHLSNGEIGCLISHLACYYYAQQFDPDNYTLIFEDDADTLLNRESWSTYLRELDQLLAKHNQLELIYLGKCRERCLDFQPFSDSVVSNQSGGRLYIANSPLCTHAMLIKNKGHYVKYILRQMQWKAIDVILANYIKANHESPDTQCNRCQNGNSLFEKKKTAKKRNLISLVYHPSLFYQDAISTESSLRNKISQLGTGVECNETTQIVPFDSFLTLDLERSSILRYFRDAPFERSLITISLIVLIIVLTIVILSRIYSALRSQNSTKS